MNGLAAVSTLLWLSLALPTMSHSGQLIEGLGEVSFPTSCAAEVQGAFNRAIALLHSFEFEESRGVFERIAEREPDCSMAHWGVATTYYHPLWAPPTERDLQLGRAAAERALALPAPGRERAYVEASAAFYRDYERIDHRTRARSYEAALALLHESNPDDQEAQILHILAILSNADPTDRTYAVQLRTGTMLESLFARLPNHPGLAHYIIHSYDYPSLAHRAVEAAHSYLEIAPALPHALHMSAHIFTQEGMWPESIHANTLSAEAARDRGQRTGALAQAQLAEMHALDYLVYAYLQRGENDKAREILEHVAAQEGLNWSNGVVAFNAGAVPARYALERHRWYEAASIPRPSQAEAAGGNFETRALVALIYWARAVGAARSGQIDAAEQALARVEEIAAELSSDVNVWARNTAEVLRLEAAAWLALAKADGQAALRLMRAAADVEDETDKSSVSPGRVLPVHEQLADLLMELDRPTEALREYEISFEHAGQRFNSNYGAAKAARAAGQPEVARHYYRQLLQLTAKDSARAELDEARAFLGQ